MSEQAVSKNRLSIEERYNQLINNTDDIYDNDQEADEIRDNELARIEEAYKCYFRKQDLFDSANPWNYSQAGWLSKKLISKHLNPIKSGLHSIFPIPCRQGGCPYGENCIALQNNLEPPYGEPCVMEAYKIENLLYGYAKDFDLDSCSATDQALIKELVQLDIIMDRCQILLAQQGDVLQDVTIGISDTGEEVKQKAVSKYLDAYERCSKRRQSLLNEMMGTRHSRKGLKEQPINEDEIILKMVNANEDFDKVEERPDKFKQEQ